MKRIVVVDDQPILGAIYRAKFAAEGFQVEVAADGQQGLELIQRTRPDLVLLDLNLPKIDGLEVLRRLRAKPFFQNLPIIVFSGNARSGITNEAFAAGATMVLSKSKTSPKQMIEIVNKTLGHASPPPVPGVSKSLMADGVGAAEAQTTGSIVLLEDNPDTREIISLILRRKGHRVTTAFTQADGMMLARGSQVDLFLINRGQGDSAASFCRELHTAFPDTPVIVYSTAALPTEEDEVLRAGASRYLSTADELLDVAGISSSLIADSQENRCLVITGPIGNE